jgi:rhamnosyltransferase
MSAVCAVVVTYQARRADIDLLIRSLEGAAGQVVVIDNGSPELEESAFHGATLKKLPANLGIAAAQNEGIRLARSFGARYVVFLDQDSKPQPGMVARLVSALERLRAAGHKVACVGPELRLPGSNEPSFFRKGLGSVRCAGEEPVECDYLIASGTLIPLEVLQRVGELDETLFIDQVDTEWCYRARAMGYRVFAVCGAVLEHELGAERRRIWLGRWRRVPRHKPFRYYYMFRNSLLLARRGHVPFTWKVRQWAWLSLVFVFFGVLGGRGELGWMLKGLRDGLRGVGGKLAGQQGM